MKEHPDREIENVFLSFLKENSSPQSIAQESQHFKPEDWQRLFKLAKATELASVFCFRLSSLYLNNLPGTLALRFKNIYLRNLKRNLIFERELIKILSYLREECIPVIPLKGPFLARRLYEDVGLRQCPCDLDLLVQPERFQEAREKLQNLGYFCNQYNAEHTKKFISQIMLSKSMTGGGNVIIDLHHGFRDRFTDMNVEQIWSNAKIISLDGYQAQAPSFEDLLLYLTLESMRSHIYIQNFLNLKYIYDIHNLIAKFNRDINWRTLEYAAGRLNLNAALYFALKISKELFDTNTPKNFLDQIKPPLIKESILKLWINKNNILRKNRKIALSYAWRYVAVSYLYSKNAFASIRMMHRKIFLPMADVMGLYGQPLAKVSYGLYMRRLLNPILGIKS